MDLSKFTTVDSIDVTIYHNAFTAGQEPVFTMAGPCHAATMTADKARTDAIVKSRGRFNSEKLALAHTSARILGWKNVSWAGKVLPFSLENALMLLAQPALKFAKDQINIALGNDEDFFKV